MYVTAGGMAPWGSMEVDSSSVKPVQLVMQLQLMTSAHVHPTVVHPYDEWEEHVDPWWPEELHVRPRVHHPVRVGVDQNRASRELVLADHNPCHNPPRRESRAEVDVGWLVTPLVLVVLGLGLRLADVSHPNVVQSTAVCARGWLSD